MSTKMRKLTYTVVENNETYKLEFITDRTPSWTEEQYTRHRPNCKMKLVEDKPTEQTTATSNKVY